MWMHLKSVFESHVFEETRRGWGVEEEVGQVGWTRLISENRASKYYRSCSYGNRDSKVKHETADRL